MSEADGEASSGGGAFLGSSPEGGASAAPELLRQGGSSSALPDGEDSVAGAAADAVAGCSADVVDCVDETEEEEEEEAVLSLWALSILVVGKMVVIPAVQTALVVLVGGLFLPEEPILRLVLVLESCVPTRCSYRHSH